MSLNISMWQQISQHTKGEKKLCNKRMSAKCYQSITSMLNFQVIIILGILLFNYNQCKGRNMGFCDARKLDCAARPKEILIGRRHVSEESYKISMKTSLQKQNTLEQLNFLCPWRNFVALQQLCAFLFLWKFINTELYSLCNLKDSLLIKLCSWLELPLGWRSYLK